MITYKDFEPVNRSFVVSVKKNLVANSASKSCIRFNMSNLKSIEWVLGDDQEVTEIYDKVIAEFVPIVLTYSGE